MEEVVVVDLVAADCAAYSEIELTIFHLQFDLRVKVGGDGVGWFCRERYKGHAFGCVDETNEFLAVCTNPVLAMRAVESVTERCWLRDCVRVQGERRTVVYTLMREYVRCSIDVRRRDV